MNRLWVALIAAATLVAAPAHAAGYYLCQDPKTGRKIGQDHPCEPGKELGSYAPVGAAEQKEREEAARRSKREFERRHPGTYPPEEYMTEEELAAYRVEEKQRREERKKEEDRQAIQDALRRSEQAEQRAREAERAAREAKEKAAEAEAAANSPRYPLLLPPPRPPRSPRIRNCDAGGCWDEQGRRYPRGGAGVFIGPSGACRKEGNVLRCP